MEFELTDKQRENAGEWMAKHRTSNQGAIGGQFTYEFTPTTIGVIVKVRDCITHESIDLTEYETF